MSDKKLALVAKDNTTFEMSEDVAFLSDLLKDACTFSDNKEDEKGIKKIAIKRAEGIVLGKVSEWMEQHVRDYKELTEKWVDAQRKDAELEGWDAEFFHRLTQEELFDIFDVSVAVLSQSSQIANFMRLSPLYWQCAKYLSYHMQGLSVEDLRRLFGIKGDFTPEEEAAIKKDYVWCSEGAID